MALWLYFLFKLICTHVIKEGGVKIASGWERENERDVKVKNNMGYSVQWMM